MITENDVRYAQKMVALKYAVEAIDWYHQGKTRWWRPGWWVQRYLTRMYESILDEKTAIHMIDAAKGEIE